MKNLTSLQQEEVKELMELTTLEVQSTWITPVQLEDGKILIQRLLDLTCNITPTKVTKKYVIVFTYRDDYENPTIIFQDAIDEDVAEHNAIVSLFIEEDEIDDFYNQIEEGIVTFTIEEIKF